MEIHGASITDRSNALNEIKRERDKIRHDDNIKSSSYICAFKVRTKHVYLSKLLFYSVFVDKYVKPRLR